MAPNHEIYELKDLKQGEDETIWNRGFILKVWKEIEGKINIKKKEKNSKT
jgi:hypothetical protein